MDEKLFIVKENVVDEGIKNKINKEEKIRILKKITEPYLKKDKHDLTINNFEEAYAYYVNNEDPFFTNSLRGRKVRDIAEYVMKDKFPISVQEDLEDCPVLKDIYDSVHYNGANVILLVQGLPRTGKSETCQYLAWALDRDAKTGEHLFDVEKQTARTMEEVTEKIVSLNRVGGCIIWEEAGVSGKGANSRDFLKEENKLFNNVFQIMGLKRQIILINLPWGFMLDKGARSLTHYTAFTHAINRSQKRCYVRFRSVVHYPEFNNDIRYLKPKFYTNNRMTKLRYAKIPLAPFDIREKYLKLQKNMKPLWIQEFSDAIQQLRKSKIKMKDRDLNWSLILVELERERGKYLRGKGVSTTKIKALYKPSEETGIAEITGSVAKHIATKYEEYLIQRGLVNRLF